MIAVSEIEIERLQTRIKILERNGQFGIADRLRGELADLQGESFSTEEADEPDDAPVATEEDYAQIVSAMELFGRIKRIVARLGINEPTDLAHWNVERFRKARLSQRDIEYIYCSMATLGMSDIIGSGDVPDTVPEPSPYAVDIMDGRTAADCEQYLWDLARGKPQRDVSFEMGSPRGWHQRAGSLIGRHNRNYAGKVAHVIKEEFKHAEWLKRIDIECLDVRERPWTLRIRINVSVSEAAKELDIVPKKVHGGMSFRAVRIILDTGESEVRELQQAAIKKLDGKYRVVDERGVPLKRKDGVPLDKSRRAKRAGHDRAAAANEQANAINATLANRKKKEPTRKQKRAARSAEIAAKRAGRGGAVHE